MRNIQMVYAKWHNRRFHRRGSFWEGRFRATLLIDLDAIQERLLYVELNPVRAGLVQRPERWTRPSAYLRDLKKDHWLLSLEKIFPEVPHDQVDQHYRAWLLYRGALPREPGGKVIPEQVLGEEATRGSCRRGLYLKRLDILQMGSLWEAKKVSVNGLLGSGAGTCADATPFFMEDSPAVENSAPVLLKRVLEGNMFRSLSTNRVVPRSLPTKR